MPLLRALNLVRPKFAKIYNKTGADSSEPAEDAKNRGGSHKTGQSQRPSTGSSETRRKPNPPVPSTKKGSSSKGTTTTKQRKQEKNEAPGGVYVIDMGDCANKSSPPFGKVGRTTRTANDCKARVQQLQTGNPFKLRCRRTFLVRVDPEIAERAAHDKLKEEHLHLKTQQDCEGGEDWFLFPDGQRVASLIDNVRQTLSQAGWIVSEQRDWVESSINPSISPNQSPQFVYNSKWRQVPCRGNELQHITYNCK